MYWTVEVTSIFVGKDSTGVHFVTNKFHPSKESDKMSNMEAIKQLQQEDQRTIM